MAETNWRESVIQKHPQWERRWKHSSKLNDGQIECEKIPTNHVTIQGYKPASKLEDDPNHHTNKEQNNLTTTGCFSNKELQPENKNIAVSNDTKEVISELDTENEALRNPASFWIPLEETDSTESKTLRI